MTDLSCVARRQAGCIRASVFGIPSGGEAPPAMSHIATSRHGLVLSSCEQTHQRIVETLLRLDLELERMEKHLGELPPQDLAELAWRIDSPDLMEIALRLEEGLQRHGLSFESTTACQRNWLVSEPAS